MSLPLASELEARRVALGWSQERLSHLTGYHENTVHRVLRGHSTNWRTFVDVANALGFVVTLAPTTKGGGNHQ